MEETKKTCLHDKHVALGALMKPFGGFDMPIQYSSITEEHQAVRNACGVFDVSHMGEVKITGPKAQEFVNLIFTNNVTEGAYGQCYYGMMLQPDGTVVDDLLVYKYSEEHFLLVINAANIDKDWAWIVYCLHRFPEVAAGVKAENLSDQYGELAIQGPEAEKVVSEVLGIPCGGLKYYNFDEFKLPLSGHTAIVSRTGYTGEDGFEVYASHDDIRQLWDQLMESKRALPCGLGCRDTLRFEAGLPLYGDELSDSITPVEAGLTMFVKFKEKDFVGRDAVAAQKENGVAKKVVGLEMADKAIPRHGYEVLNDNDEVIGTITTGYHGVTTDRSQAFALIDAAYSKLGTPLKIRIRKKTFPCTVVKKRFYQRPQ